MVTHRHHIIPKHEWKLRFGNLKGVNDSDNIVYLSLDQHADVHRILWEMYQRDEDNIAFMSLSSQLDNEELMLKLASLGGSMGKGNPKKMGINNSFFGKHHSVESRRKIGDHSRSRNKGKVPWNKGIVGHTHTPKSIEKIRNAKLGKPRTNFIPWNKGKKGQQIAWNKGLKIKNHSLS